MPLFSLIRTVSTQVHCFAPQFASSPSPEHIPNFHSPQQKNAVVQTPPTPLHLACERGDVKAALAALSQAALNAQDAEGETPAMKAAKTGSVRTLELLIKAGANFEIADLHGWTVLHWTVQSGHAEIVSTILDYAPVLLNARDRRGLTPLHVAAWTGNPVLIRRLLAEGADLHATTQWGETPLHMAAHFGHVQAAEALLAAGADATKEDRMKRSPLGLARALPSPDRDRIINLFESQVSS